MSIDVFLPPSDSVVCLVVVDWPFPPSPVLLLLILVERADAGECSQRMTGHKNRGEKQKKNQKDNNPILLFLFFLLCPPRLHHVGLFSQDSISPRQVGIYLITKRRLWVVCFPWRFLHKWIELSRVVFDRTHKGGRWHRNMEHRSR